MEAACHLQPSKANARTSYYHGVHEGADKDIVVNDHHPDAKAAQGLSRVLRGCVVSALNLVAQATRGMYNPQPAVTVNDARLARGEGSRATSRKP